MGARTYCIAAFSAVSLFVGKTETARAKEPVPIDIAPTFLAYNCNPHLLTVEGLNRSFYVDATPYDSLKLGKALLEASRGEVQKDAAYSCIGAAVMVYQETLRKIPRSVCLVPYDEKSRKKANSKEKLFMHAAREYSNAYIEVAQWFDMNRRRTEGTRAIRVALHFAQDEAMCYLPAVQRVIHIEKELERRLATPVSK